MELYLHYFLRFCSSNRIYFLDVLIGEILNSLIAALCLVLGHLGLLFHILGLIVCIASDITDSNLCILAKLCNLL